MARPKTHTAEVAERLMECALEAVARDGIGSLPLRSIAERAETSTTAVYALFGNKEGMQRAVLTRAFGEFADDQELIEVTDDPVTDIAGLGAHYVQWAIDHPRLYEAMYGEALAGLTPSEELSEARLRAVARISDAVQRALDSGAFRPADHATVVVSLWAQVHGLATLMMAGHLPDGADPALAAWATIEGWFADARR
ncbi:TetR/AcrR family transcriptional regulator [Nocardioides speluncae]|uniref:TetR/AcrR family transcriptional regulator n=1 Tax=Nocardioides speluncae TaxID=2670337 RepID=UPI000D699DBE|nr:TetR/AcrR family transcriptional regulator [Nocardioides speluncae]